MRIGLTGGIASGKSTVAAMLARRGAVIIDADRLARKAVAPGQPALEEIKKEFGPDFIDGRGELKRKQLGDLVFSDPRARRRLNAITHPRVYELLRRQEQQHRGKIVIFDIPLLYETGFDKQLDFVIVVYANPKVQLQRLQERDGLSLPAARQRVQAQMPLEEKKQKSDFVIDNSHGLENTETQVDRLWAILKGKHVQAPGDI